MPLLRLLSCTLLLIQTLLPAGADEPQEETIDRRNAVRHAALLSPGQQALLTALPATFRLTVHATTAVTEPPSSEPARLTGDGSLAGLGRGLPFPRIESGDPEGGLKAIWNHRLRTRGSSRERTTVQAIVLADGSLDRVDVRERLHGPADAGVGATGPDALLVQHLTAISAPPRLAGSLKLVNEPLSGPVRGWQRSPGPDLPSIRATTDAGGDTPVIGTDGLLMEDQVDGFRGDPARWRWTLVERDMRLVPWQAESLHARDGALASLLTPHHPDPARLRHERRPVLHLEARLRPGETSPWPRRHYFLDAATWQVVRVEYHGRDDRLERVQEVHVRLVDGVWLPVVNLVHDLPGQRYLITGIETLTLASVPVDLPDEALTPKEATRWAKAAGAAPARPR
jgi:hypothetical protein